jgi:O-antigen/teichoic acid export membrane protein
MSDLKAKALRGGFAKMCAQALNFSLRIGSMMILARALEPSDFGLVGMVTAVTGAFSLFKDAGLSVVTVQRAAITDDELSALFWVNMLVGLVLALFCVAAAPALVSFYGEPRLFWVACLSGAGFLFNAAGVQHSAILQRQMRFVALSVNDTLSWVGSLAIGIGLALAGFGYWALVWMTVSLPAISTAGLWLTTWWRPSMPSRKANVKGLIRSGGTVTLNMVIMYVAYNLDKILIGRIWGAAALGIYGRAYQLVNIPTENLNSAVGGVAVSVLARVQDNALLVRNYFLKSYSLVLTLTLPITITCALFADDVVVVLLGRKWVDAIPIFRLMAPTILALALMNPVGWFLFASGRMGRSLKAAFVIAPVVVLAYGLGLPYGATGVALGYSVAMALLALPMIAYCLHGTVITFRSVLGVISRPAIAALIAAAIGLAVRYSLAFELAPFPRLVIESAVVFGSYAVILLFAMGQKAFYLDIVSASGHAVMNRSTVPAVD